MRKLRAWAILEWRPTKNECALFTQRDKRVIANFEEKEKGGAISLSFVEPQDR